MKHADYEGAFREKSTLIAGGLGFIGSNLAHRLVVLGARVTIVDALLPGCGGNRFNVEAIRDRVRIEQVDLRDVTRLGPLLKQQDYVFNLAGKTSHVDSMRDPLGDLEINSGAQLSLLEACRQSCPDARIMYAGTRGQYGRPERLPVTEAHPLNPVDINGINKTAAEAYHMLYNRIHGMRTTSLRLTNTYGPRHLMLHGRQGFLNYFVRLAMDGEEIPVFGDGCQLRDFNFVDDAVSAFMVAAVSEGAVGQCFNLGGGHPVSVLEAAQLVVHVVGQGGWRQVPFPDDLKAIDIGSYEADFSRIRKCCGWEKEVDLEDGLRKTIGFYEEFRDQYWDRP